MYSRTTAEFKRGNFRVKGDTVDIYLAYNDFAYRVLFFGEEIEEIISFDPNTGETIEQQERVMIYPANLYVSPKDRLKDTIEQIQDDLVLQIEFFKEEGRFLEAKTS